MWKLGVLLVCWTAGLFLGYYHGYWEGRTASWEDAKALAERCFSGGFASGEVTYSESRGGVYSVKTDNAIADIRRNCYAKEK